MKDIPNNFYNLDIYGKSSKRPYNPRGKMFGYNILGFGSGGRNYQVRYLVLAGGAGGVSTGGGSGYQGGGF